MPGSTVLEPGTVFAGEFRVVRPLKQGGMGFVYEAEQLSTGHLRALKLMNPALSSNEKMRKRFAQEARIGSKIDSDHVVQVVAAGVDSATGIPWIAMELLKGRDLSRWLHKRDHVSWEEIDNIFGQLCHALAAAHAVSIVHRDLKPENIFMATPRREGVPFMIKVLDFGLAKFVVDAAVTKTEALGTPLWMAPEQTVESRDISPATDVWALGLIAFRLMTGKHYWQSCNGPLNPVLLLREIKTDPIEPASLRAHAYACEHLIVPGFDDWFARCVDRDPKRRFQEARAAREALGALIARTRPRPAQPEPKPAETRRIVVAAAAGACLAGLIVLVIATSLGRSEPLQATLRPIHPALAIASESQPASVAPSASAAPPSASAAAPPVKLGPAPVDASVPDARAAAPVATPPRVEPSATSRPPAESACDPPYTIDRYGTRIPKPDCM
ncbi:MAG: serine/threonine protein kinase [Deltaproteobacteria bacterium]|nr:serine/threonine protein kinase [Deltaproteobacteria bacterium]